MISAVVLAFGFIGTAGFAMLMAFVRSLVEVDALRPNGLDDAGERDRAGGVPVRLDRSASTSASCCSASRCCAPRTTPRWVPFALLLHVLTLPLSSVLPEAVSKATILLLVVGFAGIAVQATSPQHRRRFT